MERIKEITIAFCDDDVLYLSPWPDEAVPYEPVSPEKPPPTLADRLAEYKRRKAMLAS